MQGSRTAQGEGRGAALGREARRVGAGAWDATAGGFGFMRRKFLGKSLGFFFFLILCMCNVTSPAPWWRREAQRFLLRGHEGLRAKYQLQVSLQFLQLGVFPSLPSLRRPSIILRALMGS